MATDELLNVAQAAAHLGIRPWTLRHWISDGKIDIVKYGNGVVRIRRSVLDRYVAACTIKAKSRQHDGRKKEPRLLERTDLEQPDESLVR
jgi:excisionase family DNA binding protein